MEKYIEIEGIKYVIDPNDKTKALLDDKGEKILYVEETPPVDPPVDPPKDTPTKASLEELAKTNPDVARMLKDKAEAEEKIRLAEEAAEEARTEKLKENGEFQKLAEEADDKRKTAEAEAKESKAVLDKYKGTVNGIRDTMVDQIPEDKRSLIPDGNARKQIDYIQKNAQFLGVSVISKGGGVPPNGDNPPLDEEGKLRKEFADLLATEELTHTQKERMSEVSKLLKGIDARKT